MGESIIYGIKALLIAAATAAFLMAIVSLTSTIVEFSSNSVVGDVFQIISMCLPFNALTVFSSILASIDVIITWVVARKIYSIVMKSNEAN